MGTNSHHGHHALSKAGLLITLGIIFGDIGTSPLYVMKAIVGEGAIIDRLTVLGEAWLEPLYLESMALLLLLLLAVLELFVRLLLLLEV